jgi:hypothetical protein
VIAACSLAYTLYSFGLPRSTGSYLNHGQNRRGRSEKRTLYTRPPRSAALKTEKERAKRPMHSTESANGISGGREPTTKPLRIERERKNKMPQKSF